MTYTLPPRLSRWLRFGALLLVPVFIYAVLARHAPLRPNTLDYSDPVIAVSYSPNGQWLGCASTTQAELRDAHSLHVIWSQSFLNAGAEGSVHRLAFAPDSQRFAFSQTDTIQLWNIQPLRLWRTLKLPGWQTTFGMSFAPDNSSLIISGLRLDVSQQSLLRWDLMTGHHQTLISSPDVGPAPVAFSLNSSKVAFPEVIGRGIALHIYDCATGQQQSVINIASNDYFTATNFTPDSKLIATTSSDGIVLRNTRNGQRVGIPVETSENENIHCLAFSPDGKTLAFGDMAGVIRLRDVKSGHLQRTLDGWRGNIYDLAFAPDGTTLTAACYGNALQLWRIK